MFRQSLLSATRNAGARVRTEFMKVLIGSRSRRPRLLSSRV